ncbi:hypothetical protein [Bacillus sp. T33-2]|uniref:hypothetical protein n=1 Tax=Bacillus sp. T33-2 TaxID=2054168 RepID=UPI0015E11A71|nr:hypothetical protein [Bacillus sp. T33-2]
MSQRKDAWTKEDDDRLAAMVIEYLNSGKTKIEAFKQAGAILSRTPGACRYRWNVVLKDRFAGLDMMDTETIKDSEVQRHRVTGDSVGTHLAGGADESDTLLVGGFAVKTVAEHLPRTSTETNTFLLDEFGRPPVNLASIIDFLDRLDKNPPSCQNQAENEALKKELVSLTDINQSLAQSFKKKQQEYKKLEEDYSLLLRIIQDASELEEKSEAAKMQ